MKVTEIDRIKSKNKLRVAAYCRVSTDQDEQLASLEAQKSHYKSYIKSNEEWKLAGIYYDEGISGTKKESRNGLLSMLEDCENGLIDLIITKSISRFARNTTDCLEMVRRLSQLGIYIIFEKENINTESMESELMLSILASLAESESISISENNKWSIRKRFEKGTFIISYPPYGYTNINGNMIVVESEAEVVKSIFDMCLEEKGAYKIAQELNKRNILSKKEGKWNYSSVTAILKNEKYTGDAIFQKTYTDDKFCRHRNNGEKDMFICENHHEAIISHEVFDKVQMLLKQRAFEKGNGKNTDKYHNRYAFSGKIKCGQCGSSFKRKISYRKDGQNILWSCNKHIENKEECSMLAVDDYSLKHAFVIMMNKLVFSYDEILKPFIISLKGMNIKDIKKKITVIDKELSEIERRKQMLMTLVAQGILDPQIFTAEKQSLLENEKSFKLERKQLTDGACTDKNILKEAKKLAEFTSQGIMLEDFREDLFLAFVKSVTVHNKWEVTFHLKCNLNLKERLEA